MEANLVVADLVNNQGNWCLDRVVNILPREICQHIRSLPPPHSNRPRDRVAWRLTKDGEFSTASAYESLIGPFDEQSSSLFKLIWHWPGIERVRVLIWKMALNALGTNNFIFIRGHSPNGLCPLCNQKEETILHMVRDCEVISQIWLFLSENSLPQMFSVEDTRLWISQNLKMNISIKGVKWKTLFGAATSCIWQARNVRVFQGKVIATRELGIKALYQALAFHQSYVDLQQLNAPLARNSYDLIHWKALDPGILKLNCDGAVGHHGDVAAGGGVLRDHRGDLILAFASPLGHTSALEAKIRAIHIGINLVRLKRCRKVIIETDSRSAVRLIKEGCSSLHLLFNLISEIHKTLQLERNFSIDHIFREANRAADCFAKSGMNLDNCSRVFYCIPHFAANVLMADVAGTNDPMTG